MAALKKILKLTHNDANVKITSASADSATVGIQTDMKLGSESFSMGVVSVALSTGGSGYTAPPQVLFTPVGTGGSDASAVAVLTSGVVTDVRVTNYGSGYTAAPTVAFVPAGTGGTGAVGTASLYTAARVAIEKIMWSVSPVSGASMTITRNAEAVAVLYGSGEMDLNARGMTDDTHAAYDIGVAFAGSGGTAYLKLKKVSGYGD
jgi:hypothetical protein